jgi:hypothetical protein
VIIRTSHIGADIVGIHRWMCTVPVLARMNQSAATIMRTLPISFGLIDTPLRLLPAELAELAEPAADRSFVGILAISIAPRWQMTTLSNSRSSAR